MLISMHVIIGKANEYFSVWMKISPGNLPNGNFLKNGKSLGKITINGKLMFIYQALSAFNIWHGLKPDVNKNVIKFLDQWLKLES